VQAWVGRRYGLLRSLACAKGYHAEAHADEHRPEFLGPREANRCFCREPECPSEGDLASKTEAANWGGF
jgi:hypothetical protein